MAGRLTRLWSACLLVLVFFSSTSSALIFWELECEVTEYTQILPYTTEHPVLPTTLCRVMWACDEMGFMIRRNDTKSARVRWKPYSREPLIHMNFYEWPARTRPVWCFHTCNCKSFFWPENDQLGQAVNGVGWNGVHPWMQASNS